MSLLAVLVGAALGADWGAAADVAYAGGAFLTRAGGLVVIALCVLAGCAIGYLVTAQRSA